MPSLLSVAHRVLLFLLFVAHRVLLFLRRHVLRREIDPHAAVAGLIEAPESSHDQPSDVPEGSCRICFDAGPDPEGRLPERACSCRGSAALCHLSCIMDHAKHRSKAWDGYDVVEFTKPWERCPTCHQLYQKDIALGLAREMMKFVDVSYPGDRLLSLYALNRKTRVLIAYHLPTQKKEAQETVEKMFGVVEEGNASSLSSSATDVRLLQYCKAEAHYNCGILDFREGTTRSTEIAVADWKKSLMIYRSLERKYMISHVENVIAKAQARLNGHTAASKVEVLEKSRKCYEEAITAQGETSDAALWDGLILARSLRACNRAIEALRLSSKLAALSMRLHGPDHDITKQLDASLELSKKRTVVIEHQGERKAFRALRWDEAAGGYEVQGPIKGSGAIRDKTPFTVGSDAVRLVAGTPVLRRRDGKIGDVRSRDKDSGRYTVFFEGDDEPCLVDPADVRIVFDLPEQ